MQRAVAHLSLPVGPYRHCFAFWGTATVLHRIVIFYRVAWPSFLASRDGERWKVRYLALETVFHSSLDNSRCSVTMRYFVFPCFHLRWSNDSTILLGFVFNQWLHKTSQSLRHPKDKRTLDDIPNPSHRAKAKLVPSSKELKWQFQMTHIHWLDLPKASQNGKGDIFFLKIYIDD